MTRLRGHRGHSIGRENSFSPHEPEEQGSNEEDDEDEEEHTGDFNGAGSNTGEAEERGDQCNHKKDDGVMEHFVSFQPSGLLRNWRAKMKAPNLRLWLGANRSNSHSYCEDEQQRQGHKGKLSWIV